MDGDLEQRRPSAGGEHIQPAHARKYARGRNKKIECYVEVPLRPLTSRTDSRKSAGRSLAELSVPHRLRSLKCQWTLCDATLDSLERLRQHILTVHVPESYPGVLCLWIGCGHDCSDVARLVEHVESEHLSPLAFPCPYTDCAEMFSSEKLLRGHIDQFHSSHTSKLRPLAQPLTRPEAMSLPELPVSVPGYTVEYAGVPPSTISEEFHNQLGPWALRRIIGPGRLRAIRTEPSVPLNPVHERYAFLNRRSKSKSKPGPVCDDLILPYEPKEE